MDAATFLKNRKTKTPDVVSEPASSSVKVFRDTTPSGLVVEYCPGDGAKVKRWYSVNGERVPSVTTVLDCLSKPGLSWWGMKVGVESVINLFDKGKLSTIIDWESNEQIAVITEGKDTATVDNVTALLTVEKLTVNHVLNKAADRGTNVHDALEQWARSGGEFFPTPQNFPEEERPYVEALLSWIQFNENYTWARPALCEVMVGSAEHGFAGRYDLVIETTEHAKIISKKYKRKEDVFTDVPPGRYLVDLKTSGATYSSHHLQLAAYELASIESGYPATDGRFVLRLDRTGFYEFVPCQATGEDFLAVKSAHDRLKRLK